jgi:PII-like signaling protein
MHLGGATVLRGPMGFGQSSRLHTAKILRLSEGLPIVVEIVDSEAKINEFLPVLDSMMSSGLVTIEKVQVLRYGGEGRERRAGL